MSTAVESKEDEAKLVSQFFTLAASKELYSSTSTTFEESLTPVAERLAALPPLDAIGVEPIDHTHAMFQGGSGHHRPSSAVPPSCQASVDLAWWIYMLTPVLKYCFHLTCLAPLLGESTCLPLYLDFVFT